MDGEEKSTEASTDNDELTIVNGDIPLRPNAEEMLKQTLEELAKPHTKKKLKPGDTVLLTGQVVSDVDAAKSASALGLSAEWVQRSKHAITLAKWTAQFPSVQNMMGHAQIDIGTLDRIIGTCEIIMVDKAIPTADKLKWFQTIVAAVKTKSNLMMTVSKAAMLQEGIREDLRRDEKRPQFAPPSTGPIQINVHQGGTVEVSEKEKEAV